MTPQQIIDVPARRLTLGGGNKSGLGRGRDERVPQSLSARIRTNGCPGPPLHVRWHRPCRQCYQQHHQPSASSQTFHPQQCEPLGPRPGRHDLGELQERRDDRRVNRTSHAARWLAARAVSKTQINLAWNHVAGANGYLVDEWINGDWTLIGSGAAATPASRSTA